MTGTGHTPLPPPPPRPPTVLPLFPPTWGHGARTFKSSQLKKRNITENEVFLLSSSSLYSLPAIPACKRILAAYDQPQIQFP